MGFRQTTRVQVECPCDFLGAEIFGEGLVINLSLQGCGVESTIRVPVGASLGVRIMIPDHFFPASIEQAIVLWSTEHRFGMKFIHTQSEDQARLRRVLKLSPSIETARLPAFVKIRIPAALSGLGLRRFLGRQKASNTGPFGHDCPCRGHGRELGP